MVSSARTIQLKSTVIAKLLPLLLIIPLWWRLQTLEFLPAFTFDVTQFAYFLALAVAVGASYIEILTAKRGRPLAKALDVGIAIALGVFIVGIGLLVFVLATNYDYLDANTNLFISYYLLVAIFILGVQGIREIADKSFASKRTPKLKF